MTKIIKLFKGQKFTGPRAVPVMEVARITNGVVVTFVGGKQTRPPLMLNANARLSKLQSNTLVDDYLAVSGIKHSHVWLAHDDDADALSRDWSVIGDHLEDAFVKHARAFEDQQKSGRR